MDDTARNELDVRLAALGSAVLDASRPWLAAQDTVAAMRAAWGTSREAVAGQRAMMALAGGPARIRGARA